MNADTLFTKTHPLKLFFIVAIPGIISMLAATISQTLDGILIGQCIGEAAFAALAFATPFVVINFALADLLGVGASVPLSLALGKGNRKEADNIFTCALIMILAAGIITGFLFYILAPSLFSLMGADAELTLCILIYP